MNNRGRFRIRTLRGDAHRPDAGWIGDITYIATGEGWLYLASVLDLGSRRWLGYSMAGRMHTELVADTLDMAVATRGGRVKGVIFHGDRGSQPCQGATANWSPTTA